MSSGAAMSTAAVWPGIVLPPDGPPRSRLQRPQLAPPDVVEEAPGRVEAVASHHEQVAVALAPLGDQARTP